MLFLYKILTFKIIDIKFYFFLHLKEIDKSMPEYIRTNDFYFHHFCLSIQLQQINMAVLNEANET